MEEENVIRPHQEIQALSIDEKKFLLAVERGDVAGTRRYVQIKIKFYWERLSHFYRLNRRDIYLRSKTFFRNIYSLCNSFAFFASEPISYYFSKVNMRASSYIHNITYMRELLHILHTDCSEHLFIF